MTAPPHMRYAIRVDLADGAVLWLREGPEPGEGDVVRFPSRSLAKRTLALVEPGLEAGDVARIVPAPLHARGRRVRP